MLEVTPLKNREGFEFFLNGDKVWCVVDIYGYWLDNPPPNSDCSLAHVEFFNDFSIGVYQTE